MAPRPENELIERSSEKLDRSLGDRAAAGAAGPGSLAPCPPSFPSRPRDLRGAQSPEPDEARAAAAESRARGRPRTSAARNPRASAPVD